MISCQVPSLVVVENTWLYLEPGCNSYQPPIHANQDTEVSIRNTTLFVAFGEKRYPAQLCQHILRAVEQKHISFQESYSASHSRLVCKSQLFTRMCRNMELRESQLQAFSTGEPTSPPDEESADPTGMYHITGFMNRVFGSGKKYNSIGSCPGPTKKFLLRDDRDIMINLGTWGDARND